MLGLGMLPPNSSVIPVLIVQDLFHSYHSPHLVGIKEIKIHASLGMLLSSRVLA